MIDLVCEGCERSCDPRFPGDDPVYCDACEDEMTRCLRAGHVTYFGEIVLPVERSR